jgi:hypothetical protein
MAHKRWPEVLLEGTGKGLAAWANPRRTPSGTLGLVTEPRGVFSPAHRAITIGILLSITTIAIEGMAVATVMPSVALGASMVLPSLARLPQLEPRQLSAAAASTRNRLPSALRLTAGVALVLGAANVSVLPVAATAAVVGLFVAVPGLRTLLSLSAALPAAPATSGARVSEEQERY